MRLAQQFRNLRNLRHKGNLHPLTRSLLFKRISVLSSMKKAFNGDRLPLREKQEYSLILVPSSSVFLTLLECKAKAVLPLRFLPPKPLVKFRCYRERDRTKAVCH